MKALGCWCETLGMELQKQQSHVLEATLVEAAKVAQIGAGAAVSPDLTVHPKPWTASAPIPSPTHSLLLSFLTSLLPLWPLWEPTAHQACPCQRVFALTWCFHHPECSQMAPSLPLLRSLLKALLAKEPHPSGTYLKCHLQPTTALPSLFPCSISCITHYIILLTDF